MLQLIRDEAVFVLNLGDAENRWHPDWIADVNEALDRVEAAGNPKALVTTATGKYWSLGLDLGWVADNGGGLTGYLASAHRLLARMLTLPVPTVAAIQGHCFAAGAMMALAHDFRVMRADRGYFCLPEIDLNLAFTPAMTTLIMARMPVPAVHAAMTTGRRYGGEDARAEGIVDEVAGEGKVLGAAIAIARPLVSKSSATLGTIKETMYRDTLRLLRDERAGIGEVPSIPASAVAATQDS